MNDAPRFDELRERMDRHKAALAAGDPAALELERELDDLAAHMANDPHAYDIAIGVAEPGLADVRPLSTPWALKYAAGADRAGEVPEIEHEGVVATCVADDGRTWVVVQGAPGRPEVVSLVLGNGDRIVVPLRAEDPSDVPVGAMSIPDGVQLLENGMSHGRFDPSDHSTDELLNSVVRANVFTLESWGLLRDDLPDDVVAAIRSLADR